MIGRMVHVITMEYDNNDGTHHTHLGRVEVSSLLLPDTFGGWMVRVRSALYTRTARTQPTSAMSSPITNRDGRIQDGLATPIVN